MPSHDLPDTGTLVSAMLDLGTMVINSDTDTEATMKRHNTGSVESGKKYRPLFLDHFDKKEAPEIGKVILLLLLRYLGTRNTRRCKKKTNINRIKLCCRRATDRWWERRIRRTRANWSYKVQPPNLRGFKVICSYSCRIRYLIPRRNSLTTTSPSFRMSSRNVISTS